MSCAASSGRSTRNGARVGDLFMTLIYPCQRNETSPFDYLTELQQHADVLAACPERWMPWNYHDSLALATMNEPWALTIRRWLLVATTVAILLAAGAYAKRRERLLQRARSWATLEALFLNQMQHPGDTHGAYSPATIASLREAYERCRIARRQCESAASFPWRDIPTDDPSAFGVEFRRR
jgi:hypothetical protein